MSLPISSHSSPIPPISLPSPEVVQFAETSTSRHATEPFPPFPFAAPAASFEAPSAAADPDSSDAGSSRAHPQQHPDIEMDALTPASHRRRTSSLMSADGRSATRRSSRPRTRGGNGPEEGKISEEGSESNVMWPGRGQDDSMSDEDLHDDEETGLTGKDKRRKRQKKKRHTRLDQRIVREGISAEEKREADQSVFRRSLVNLTLIGLWYIFSLSISIVGSATFVSPRGKNGDAC